MAIIRVVETNVYCDECGEYITGWSNMKNGVSKDWAKFFARKEGCTAGKKIICKKCRIDKKMEKCSIRKKQGAVGKDDNYACSGFLVENGNELLEKCKHCIAYASFDWERETNFWKNVNIALLTLLLIGKGKRTFGKM